MTTPLKSAAIFAKMSEAIKVHGKDVVPKIQSTYLFELRADKSSAPVLFTVDLKEGNGKTNSKSKRIFMKQYQAFLFISNSSFTLL